MKSFVVCLYIIFNRVLCGYKMGFGTSNKILTDNHHTGSVKGLLCGSTVLIKHMETGLCLTMIEISNKKFIGLKECHPINIYQNFNIDCCDSFMLRCGILNPINKPLSHMTYNIYFQISINNFNNSDIKNNNYNTNIDPTIIYDKLCISTNNEWRNGKDNENLYLQECQGSYLNVTDSGDSEDKMLRDKFSFHLWDNNSKIYNNHLIQIINIKCPACLGYTIQTNNKKNIKLLVGYSCNTGLEINYLYQFKFIILNDDDKEQQKLDL
mmetsp:Transcript_996/g.1329  ORF Transcript_996/g.1329 Transcript_996/m.1329 type:complete len:267 (-) Transcript_996:131-931(-)